MRPCKNKLCPVKVYVLLVLLFLPTVTRRGEAAVESEPFSEAPETEWHTCSESDHHRFRWTAGYPASLGYVHGHVCS